MSTQAWQITARDERLLGYLISEGQATAEQLTKLFFPTLKSFYRRSKFLERVGLLESRRAIDCAGATKSGVRGLVLSLNLRRRQISKMKIYRVAREFRRRLPLGNDEICDDRLAKHQLLLNNVRMRVEECLAGRQYVVLNDPEIESETRSKMFGAPLIPDLVFRGDQVHLAVELERSEKSEADLALRFARYRDSPYEKVIYFCESEKIYRRVKKLAGAYRKIAVAFIWSDAVVFYNRRTLPLSEFINMESV